MRELASKLKLLSESEKQKVEKLVDSLISDHQTKDRKAWKEGIQHVSVWTEDDVKQVELVQQSFRRISVEEW